MARLNISVPDDLYSLSLKWRGAVNLSEVCSNALRDELEAHEGERSLDEILGLFHSPTSIEYALSHRFGLREVLVRENNLGSSHINEFLGDLAATHLNKIFNSKAVVGLGGGRQMWCVVRSLTPRRLASTITAHGFQQADSVVLNAHPNTLTTLLWLLHSPGTKAHLVGSPSFHSCWDITQEITELPRFFLIGSCAPFVAESPFASLLGHDTVKYLMRNQVYTDFLYNFFDIEGNSIPLPNLPNSSVLSYSVLQTFSQRPDSYTVLVAGGNHKIRAIRAVLNSKVCNTFVTDLKTAETLIGEEES